MSGWGCGTQNESGEGGRARSACAQVLHVSCRSAARLQPLHAPERTATSLPPLAFKPNSCGLPRTSSLHSVAAIANRLPPETFPGADVSMSLPGKLAAVLLLGLLAAQGKCRAPPRVTTWCQLPLKKWVSMHLYLCVAHCRAHRHLQVVCGAAAPSATTTASNMVFRSVRTTATRHVLRLHLCPNFIHQRYQKPTYDCSLFLH